MRTKVFNASDLVHEGFTVRMIMEEHKILKVTNGKITIPIAPVTIVENGKTRKGRLPFWNAKFEEQLKRNGGNWVKALDDFTDESFVMDGGTRREKLISLNR